MRGSKRSKKESLICISLYSAEKCQKDMLESMHRFLRLCLVA